MRGFLIPLCILFLAGVIVVLHLLFGNPSIFVPFLIVGLTAGVLVIHFMRHAWIHSTGMRRSVTPEQEAQILWYAEWLEFDVTERERRMAAMSPEERQELRAAEILYHDNVPGV